MSFRKISNTKGNKIETYSTTTTASNGSSSQSVYSYNMDLSSLTEGEGVYVVATFTPAANANNKGATLKIGDLSFEFEPQAVNGLVLQLSGVVMKGSTKAKGSFEMLGYSFPYIKTLTTDKANVFKQGSTIEILANTTTASDLTLDSVTVYKYEM